MGQGIIGVGEWSLVSSPFCSVFVQSVGVR